METGVPLRVGYAMEGPRAEDVSRIGDLTGRRPVGFRRAAGGYTPAERWVVTLARGDSVFAKIGVDSLTAGWLRDERRVYASIDGDFMPEVLGCSDGVTVSGRYSCWRI